MSESRPSRLTALALFIVASAGLYASSFLQRLIPAGWPVQLRQLAGDLVYYLPFVVLPLVILLRRRPACRAALRPNPIGFPQVLMIGGLALAAVCFVNDLDVLWAIPWQKLGFNVLGAGIAQPDNRGELILCILSVGVLPGLCEEALFRGAILSAFEPEGSRHAALISALLFTALHGSIVGAPGELLLGLVLADLVLVTDSIYAGAIFHTVYNSATLILVYAQRDGAAAAAEQDLLTQIGGGAGIMALLFDMALMALVSVPLLRLLQLGGTLSGYEPLPRKRVPLSVAERVLVFFMLAIIALMYVSCFISYLP